MSAEVAAGRTAFLDADASVQDWTGVMRLHAIEASGRPGTWRAMLTDLGTALQRARLYGFSEREVADARNALHRRRRARRPARGDRGRPARCCARSIARCRGASRSMSAAQSLELMKRTRPGHHAARRSPRRSPPTSIPTAPCSSPSCRPSDAVPAEAELVALGQVAVNVTPDKPVEAARPTDARWPSSPQAAPSSSVRLTRQAASRRCGSTTACACTTATWTSARTRRASSSPWPAARSRRRRQIAASPRPPCAPGSAPPPAPCPAPTFAT